MGLGNTEKEAEENSYRNSIKSDQTLFIPALFSTMQSAELFIKGLLLLNNIGIIITHKTDDLLNVLNDVYEEDSSIYKSIYNFYKLKINILDNYEKSNEINKIGELYNSLRYPESPSPNPKKYDYSSLMHNGKQGKRFFQELLNNLESIRGEVLKEYHLKLDNEV